jgi:hypothetical protein
LFTCFAEQSGGTEPRQDPHLLVKVLGLSPAAILIWKHTELDQLVRHPLNWGQRHFGGFCGKAGNIGFLRLIIWHGSETAGFRSI